MKQLLLSVVAITGIITASFAQQPDAKRKPTLGINFVLTDFTTAQRLQRQSLAGVLKDKDWARLNEMSYGLSVNYLQGLSNHVDFSGTLTGSYVKYPFRDKPNATTEAFLLQLDAAVNLKLLPSNYIFVPYAIAGVGASMYRGSEFAAQIPVGMGFQVNLGKSEAYLFTQGLYRVRVTSLASNHLAYSIGFAAPLK